MAQPAVVITGVSTGIGFETAKLLTQNGFQVFGSVRNGKDAQYVSKELGPSFSPLLCDVTDVSAVGKARDYVGSELNGRRLAAVVNNAGIGFGGPLALQPIDEVRHEFEVNVIGAVAVTQAFLPLLGTDPNFRGAPGRLINVGSISGRLALPFMAAYVGTKFAMEGISEALRRELRLFGISVIVVAPHSTNTPMFDKALAGGDQAYRQSPYGHAIEELLKIKDRERSKGLHPARVAKVIHKALTSSHPRLRYSIVPKPFEAWILTKGLPTRTLDWLLARRLRLDSTRELR